MRLAPASSLQNLRAFLICPRLSLVTAMMVMILGFSLLITGLITWRTMAGTSQAGRDMALKMLALAGEHIQLQTEHFCQPVVSLRDTLAGVPDAARPAQGFDHPLLGTFFQAFEQIPRLSSIYLANQDGEFYQALCFHGRPGLFQDLKAPANTAYGVRHLSFSGGIPSQAWRFYDAQGQVLGEISPEKASYDPRTRPWYQGAMAAQGGYRTEPYVFSSLKTLGITLSRPIPGTPGTVLGLDVALDSLSSFVAEQRLGPSSLVYLSSASGRLLAYPDPLKLIQKVHNPDGSHTLETVNVDQVGDPLALAVKAAFLAQGSKPFSGQAVMVDGVEYLAQVMPMPILGGENEFVSLAVPASEFTAPLERARRQGLILVGVLLVLAVPVMFFSARALAKPLEQLTAEAARVSELDLSHTPAICSHIQEVDTLCRAMAVMKANYQIFGRYLPRSLLRHLHCGSFCALGGQRREITMLFTDVADFTALSEGMDPEVLMRTMSDYFQGVTQAIIESNGTIDKFIGDAVMAFWNAPSNDDQHVVQACAAALRLQKATAAFNEKRLDQGLAPLYTRVGLHTGEAVVGNIGTDERMDYTALGAVVNLTSRLEALNKYYGTAILVSKRVREAAHQDFLFRSSDVVAPKGVAQAQAIFELMGAKPKSAYPDVAVASAMLGYCSRWERAMTMYRTKNWDLALGEFSAMAQANPQDGLAKRYVRRLERLLAEGQSPNWKAASRFTEK